MHHHVMLARWLRMEIVAVPLSHAKETIMKSVKVKHVEVNNELFLVKGNYANGWSIQDCKLQSLEPRTDTCAQNWERYASAATTKICNHKWSYAVQKIKANQTKPDEFHKWDLTCNGSKAMQIQDISSTRGDVPLRRGVKIVKIVGANRNTNA